ncbi:Hs17p [Cryptosporidium bovis]|uniref:Hs17p n=1 Tax=Cryptosporidium bovis TaxID=310047 RepID=UPI00351A6E7D|nr:Hs17p [Cryptosporidium bovis]
MPIVIKPEIFYIGLSFGEESISNAFCSLIDDKNEAANDTYLLMRVLNLIKIIGFDFIYVPVLYSSIELKGHKVHEFERMFLKHYTIKESDWNTGVIGTIPPKITLTTSKLKSILEWCTYVGYHAILIPMKQISIELASEVLYFIERNISGMQIWIELYIHKSMVDQQWENWQLISGILDNGSSSGKVGIVLNISDDLNESDITVLPRFIGEPIKCLVLSQNTIQIENVKSDKNALSKFIEDLLRLKIPISVELMNSSLRIDNKIYEDTYNSIFNYLNKLTPLTQQEKYEYDYLDILQIPLQPLFQDLKSIHYEVFEADPIKYTKYTDAIQLCLYENAEKFGQIKILIIGAGRGGLIDCSIVALKRLSINPSNIVCVEKNVNAVITLNARKHFEKDNYWKQVDIIHSDIRDTILDQNFNIIISELLGSFGDNELAPECLYSAQKFLESGGIMIPQRYTSFIEPISCKKIWNNVMKLKRNHPMETPYVSKIKSNFFVSEGPKKIFTFSHPVRKIPTINYNSLFRTVSFISKTDSILHGFKGYFECNLYNEIGFTNSRNNFTEGLISWFDFYFPINTPIRVKKGDKIDFSIWRKSTKYKVWYEWLVTNPSIVQIHNSNGKGYHMNL